MTQPHTIDIRLTRTRDGSWRATCEGEPLGVTLNTPAEALHMLADGLDAGSPSHLVDVCLRAVNELPADGQLLMLAEECSELAVAAQHLVRGRQGARDAVVEELADVLITSTQAQILLDIGAEEMGPVLARKIDRLEKRLDGRRAS